MVAKSVKSSADDETLSLVRSGLDNPIQHGGMGQGERAFSVGSTFLSGLLAISASQFIGAPLKLVNEKFYDEYMAWTKQSFAVLMTTITQWWSPTVVRVSADESMKGQLYQMEDGTLKCNFPHRLVLMANHQLYTDWLYLWWTAYTNKMHGRVYIIMKESLKQLPIFGWGAQFYNFIFVSRNWEKDRNQFRRALSHLKDPEDPMWLLIFPEGTNLSAETREKSAAWAKKTGIPDMKHQLLPRSTGLQFCLSELKHSTNWLYDCTVAYEGVPDGMYGQDLYTLRSSFFEGKPPKSVNMFWRRFKISEIPMENDAAFGRWLNNRWREKDYILEYFYKYSHFPADDPVKALAAAAGKAHPNHAKMISTEVKGGGWDEFLGIFGPLTTAAGALQAVDLTEPLNLEALITKVAEQQNLSLLDLGKLPIAASSQEAIQKALMAAQKSNPLPPGVMEYLMKEGPQMQQQMQQALVKAGKKTGNVDIARKAARAPAAPTQLPPKTQANVAKAIQKIANTPTPKTPSKNPAPAIRKPQVNGVQQTKGGPQTNGVPKKTTAAKKPVAKTTPSKGKPAKTNVKAPAPLTAANLKKATSG